MMLLLSCQNLSCIKQDRVLFEELSFELRPGQGLHLLGENGAGKTSLLRILAGLSEPASGTVSWGSDSIASFSNDYHQSLVYLGHKLALHNSLTALENLSYWCNLQSVKDTPDALDVLAKFGLVGLEELPVYQLSAGQQRRVSLSRLLFKKAKIWILDEPFTALDVKGRGIVENMIQDFLAGSGMVIFTSHQSLELTENINTLTLEYRY